VAELLKEYGLQADARRDMSWDELRAEIAADRPVIVWIIGQMWPGSPLSYTASDGHTTTVAAFEHTMILTGYDASTVQVVDASSGWTQTYPLGSFLASWETLGNMAVIGFLEGEPQPEEPSGGEESYSVQPGDYLMDLARRFNTTWENLANLNNLGYPYTIHPGQILLLPGSPENMDPPQEDQAPPPSEPAPAPAEELNRDYVVHLPVIYGVQPAVDQVEEEQDEEATPEAYTVQPGEYLVELAERFGLDWQELAELNGINYPYVIYAGQELRLR
jgi:LysM repeat protein